MGSILMLVGLFSAILTSGRMAPVTFTDTFDWGEKEDVLIWNVEDIPNPQRNPKYCRRFSVSNVCDPDEILKKEQADILDSAIQRLYNETPCLCPECSSPFGGIVIGIAVMKHIYLPYNEHHSIIIKEFAEELRRRWSLGQCKNEIIIVLVTGDRMSSTSVGPGISSYISPQESRIFHENKGHFTVGNYFKGLISMVQAYYDLSRSIKFEKEIEQVNTGLVSGIVIGVVMLFVLVILVACSLRRRLSCPPSSGNYTANGDPSHTWEKRGYHQCPQKVTEKEKRGDTENNNDKVTNAGLRESISEKGDETVGPNETLLTTVAELENEAETSPKDESHGTTIRNVIGKSEPEQSEPGVSSAPPSPHKGTITSL